MLKVKNTVGERPFGGEAAKPDLVLHVLRLVLHVLCPSRFIGPRYRPPYLLETPAIAGCESESEKVKSEK